jgi:hypothetical protein
LPDSDPWSASTVGDPAPVSPDPASWPSPSAAATDPAAPARLDGASCAQPTVSETTDASADTTSVVRPRWHWSYIDDVGWISPEEAAVTDPWGDNSTDAEPPHAVPDPPSRPTRIRSRTNDEPRTTPEEAADDPWGDSA